jgi:hypothetical protein
MEMINATSGTSLCFFFPGPGTMLAVLRRVFQFRLDGRRRELAYGAEPSRHLGLKPSPLVLENLRPGQKPSQSHVWL